MLVILTAWAAGTFQVQAVVTPADSGASRRSHLSSEPRLAYPRTMSEISTCPRHPDVETRLSCSACGDTICPNCAREAAVGYKCPDCAAQNEATEPRTSGRTPFAGLVGGRRPDGGAVGAGSGSDGPSDRLSTTVGVRGTIVGLAAAVAAGMLLGPILRGGAFFLLSSGVLGWAVARSVFWATEETSSAYLRAVALTLAAFMVAVGLVSGQDPGGDGGELAFLAFPAALYGGWIVVRGR